LGSRYLRPKPLGPKSSGPERIAAQTVKVERYGGLAGFGLQGSRVSSHGELDYAALDAGAQRAVDKLFASQQRARRQVGSGAMRDGFSYCISRGTGATAETVEVSEADVPAVISACVKDELV
jgi:hypothetical protein